MFRLLQRYVLGRQAPRLQYHHLSGRQPQYRISSDNKVNCRRGRRVQHHLRHAMQGGKQFINHNTDR